MKRTPLYDAHVRLGAKMVPFGGWDMPVFYKDGIIAEHTSVRNSAGLFDIGHMGAVKISGEQALPFLQRILTNDASRLDVGASQYSLVLNGTGGVIDDIFTYRLKDHYMLVLNASNTEKDIAWLQKNNDEGADMADIKESITLLALQGPGSQDVLQKICDIDLKSIGHHKITDALISKVPCLVSRTGYTGEDGFELFFQPGKAELIWNAIIKLGAAPCGLGARDTLRLEVGMPLYGHEYNEGIMPIETPFMFAVKLDKGDFIGKDSIVRHRAEGAAKKLVGVKLLGKGIPRQGYKIFKDSLAVGYITSGTLSPTLNLPIGMGFIRSEFSAPGTDVSIEIREKQIKAEIVKLPFYRPAGRRRLT